MNRTFRLRLVIAAVIAAIASPFLYGHCDTMDGPVVQTARVALAQGDVTPVLKWIQVGDEAVVRDAFARTVGVRQLSPAAAELADHYFLETLVRLHRAGEGEPYTGLQPAGSGDPALTEADRAIEQGTMDRLATDLSDRLGKMLRTRFQELRERQAHRNDSIAAGRRYVEAYVSFIHLYERLAAAAIPDQSSGHHH